METDTHRLPPPLRSGDRIVLLSPASKIAPEYVEGAAQVLTSRGYRVEIAPHCLGAEGSFSASAADRLADIERAILDPEVKAIICSRGGYGCVHLLPALSRLPAECFNKWLVGFSDITALHLLWRAKGFASLHAAMTKYLALGEEFPCFAQEMAILEGGHHDLTLTGSPLDFDGECEGIVTGGNLAVLGGLIGTPFWPNDTEPKILFIEDIAEPIYKVERILYQLLLSGFFDHCRGIAAGRFTEYRPSADHPDMETMIRRFADNYLPGMPLAFDLPCGHIEENAPLLLNSPARLMVNAGKSRLIYLS